MTPTLMWMAAMAAAVALVGAVVSLAPQIAEYRAMAKRLSDQREVAPVDGRLAMFGFNTENFLRDIENPEKIEMAATIGQSYFNMAESGLVRIAGIDGFVEHLCDDLWKRGAIESGWKGLKGRPVNKITVKWVPGRLTWFEAKKYQRYLRAVSSMRSEVAKPLQRIFPELALDQVMQEGLPSFRDWLDITLKDYVNSPEELAERLGWVADLAVLDERAEFKGGALSRDAKIRGEDPRSLPGNSHEVTSDLPLGWVKPNGKKRWIGPRDSGMVRELPPGSLSLPKKGGSR